MPIPSEDGADIVVNGKSDRKGRRRTDATREMDFGLVWHLHIFNHSIDGRLCR
jgi:hypothetical protein